MAAFCERLKMIREELGISQNEFSKRLGISRVSLTHYEAGDRTPDIDFLKRLHQETGMSLYYLLGLSDSKDDAFASMQKETGLSEETLKTFADDPLCTKVINHVVDCGSMKVFSKLAAILHDDTILNQRYENQEWPEFATSLREALFKEQLLSFQALAVTIFTDMKSDGEIWGIDEKLLPCCIANKALQAVYSMQITFDMFPSQTPAVSEAHKLFSELLGKLNTNKEVANAQETPE